MEFATDLLALKDRDLDPEYKKYVLLAYLKRVGERFRERRLYPYLSELKRQYTELLSYKGRKEELSNSFPRRLTGVDPQRQRLFFKELIEDEEFIQELDKIVEQSLPRIKEELERGEEIRSTVMEHIEVRPVGLLPLRKREGYLLLSRRKEWRAYRYRLNYVQGPSAERRYRDLRTHYLASFGELNSPEGLKGRLIRRDGRLPNPAVFWISSDLMVPHIETLLPLAKQLLIGSLERFETGDLSEEDLYRR